MDEMKPMIEKEQGVEMECVYCNILYPELKKKDVLIAMALT
ncbi:MAG: hypothetical protein ACTSVI_11535 [Promethearchaeota archaeon]